MTDLVFYQNRLAKNAKHLRKWAARHQLHAYRLYDCDIPEFPLIVDFYETESGTRIHLQEVETGWQQTPEEHRDWVDFVVTATAETLSIEPRFIATKTRARQRPRASSEPGEDENGESSQAIQYQPTGKRGEDLIVQEGGHRFWINLEAYLDTGLFLDHRNTRQQAGARAAGKRFLNLFAYTGSFSVYAARGGARSSTTVDLSNTYCDWAARNFALNDIDTQTHRIERADVFAWLRDHVDAVAADASQLFDLIVLDPPTFSNSKKMLGVLDVQRDHVWLIRQCLSLLSREGELYFSTNLRSFQMDELLQTKARFTEISSKSVPEDFRDKKIHRCWHIRK